MAAPEAGHHGRLPMDRSARSVEPIDAGEILARKEQMLMAKKQGVDPFHLGEVLRRVLFARRRSEPRDARVA